MADLPPPNTRRKEGAASDETVPITCPCSGVARLVGMYSCKAKRNAKEVRWFWVETLEATLGRAVQVDMKSLEAQFTKLLSSACFKPLTSATVYVVALTALIALPTKPERGHMRPSTWTHYDSLTYTHISWFSRTLLRHRAPEPTPASPEDSRLFRPCRLDIDGHDVLLRTAVDH